ncbi:MAG TPA: SDR family NAD(P)-dependent oxidoreductase [bacterium]|nr:SDR family NAD(P)-dependent oxidoreductase [bacterium]
MHHHAKQTTRLAWVVGASSGIGAALVRLLAAKGWRVIASSRSVQALEKLAQAQENIIPYALDVTDLSAFHHAVTHLQSEYGYIDLAVLNAGDYRPMSLAEFDVQLFEHLMQVNYMGVVHGLDALRLTMCQRGQGQIMITASVAGYRGLPRAAPYGATKAALINLAESLQPEFMRCGVRLRVINPGFVRTPLTAKNDFLMPALLEPEQAAQAIVAAIDRSGFEISFPAGFVLLMKLLRALPYRWYFALTRKMSA